MEINSNALIRSCHEITINAPLETVWRVHTQNNRWPDWNPDITKANLTGPIAVGTVFHWETAGMAIPSTIGEVVPLRKLAWSGETGGILGVHVWDFPRPPKVRMFLRKNRGKGFRFPRKSKASKMRWTRLSSGGFHS